MKKLLQKAMVFTLAVAMLAGTPLTASAAGLSEIYKTEDGWGNVVGDNGLDEFGNEDTRTGTVTATQTNSGVLDAQKVELKGIKLAEDEFEFELPKDAEGASLTASLDWGVSDSEVSAEKKELEKDLLKHLKWSSSNRNVVALQIPGGSYGEGSRDKINIIPKGAGEATITVSLDSDAYNIHYTQTANVTVIQYAGSLKFKESLEADAWSGSYLDLNEYVKIYADEDGKNQIKSSSDNLTFTLVNNGGKQATLKNSVLTLKKPTKTDEIVEVRVSGKYVSDKATFPIKAGSNATKVTFSHEVGSVKTTGTKFSWRVNDGNIATVTAHVDVYKKADATSPDYCTDTFTWSSANSAIVEIDGDDTVVNDEEDNYAVRLKAVAAGKAQITAKASSGKSFKLTATVSADLEEIKIENSALPNTLHSGQTIDLYEMADQYFGEYVKVNFTDAGLKWVFDEKQGDVTAMKKVATLTTKGVLTIKPNVFDPKGTQKIYVKAVNAKKIGTGSSAIKVGEIAYDKAGKDDFDLEQVTIDDISVVKKDGTTCVEIKVENGKAKNVKKGITDNIDVDERSTFTLVATGTKWIKNEDGTITKGDTIPDAAYVLGWTASGNGKIVKASKDTPNNGVIEGVKKGTATITISGAGAKANTGKKEGTYTFSAAKATFKEKVWAPSKTLTLSLKKTTIQALNKKQSIVVTPKMDKGTTTTKKDKDIAWNVYVKAKNGVNFTKEDGITIQDGKVQGNFNSYAGRRFRVTATVKDTGVTASIYFDVVEPNTKKPTFNIREEDGTESVGTTISVTAGGSRKASVNVAIRGEDLSTGAAVTYTVNKPDVAFVLQNPDPNVTNGIIIYGIKAGTAKITAKTADGKSATLTVNVVAASTQQ